MPPLGLTVTELAPKLAALSEGQKEAAVKNAIFVGVMAAAAVLLLRDSVQFAGAQIPAAPKYEIVDASINHGSSAAYAFWRLDITTGSVKRCQRTYKGGPAPEPIQCEDYIK